MARKPSNRSRIEQLVDAWEPVMQLAFLEAVRDIVSRADLGAIVTRLERGDIAGAIAAVHLDEAAFRTLDTAIAQTFNAGGASEIGALPTLRDGQGNRLVIRWDARNIRAEQWLRLHSSTLITRIMDEQRETIRRLLEQGMIDGRNPRSVGLDIVGRINRATGRRTGGVVGLTAPQSDFVASARDELLSDDPAALRHYLTRGRRDKRFDRTIMKAIAAEAPVDGVMVNRIVGRYADSLLALRGEVISRTETMAALNQSGVEAMRQAVDSGAVKAETVTKTWHTARDPRVRDSHAAQDREVVGLDAVFSNGLAYPCDPSGPAAETANCRCWCEMRVDHTAALIEEERRLAGL